MESEGGDEEMPNKYPRVAYEHKDLPAMRVLDEHGNVVSEMRTLTPAEAEELKKHTGKKKGTKRKVAAATEPTGDFLGEGEG